MYRWDKSEVVMKNVKVISVILLAAYLVLTGFSYFVDFDSPVFDAGMGLISLAAGILMFVSLGSWHNMFEK